jgi:hypothetical protein
MHHGSPGLGWQAYALTGRPDFLNYLRQREVTWPELWEFLSASSADTEALARLSGLFHIFLCPEFEQQGSFLDADGSVYPQLHTWALFAVRAGERLPEDRLRDGLSDLLAQGLLSPLYYEAVFSLYVEASAEWLGRVLPDLDASWPLPRVPVTSETGLRIRMPNYPSPYPVRPDPNDRVLQMASPRYEAWNSAYLTALGDEDEDWLDEGGEG